MPSQMNPDMSPNTLTSLAILKVNLDEGRDYFDYLRPFVMHVLLDDTTEVVTSPSVNRNIRERFGLVMPNQIVEIVLKRLTSDRFLRKQHGVYRVNSIPDPQLEPKRLEAERHINAVVSGLREYSENTNRPIYNDDDAISAICTFLGEFDVACLRAYLRGTAIPRPERTHRTDIIMVSNYVRTIQDKMPERFDSFLILLQGNMLANALLCPELKYAPKTYDNVTFYFDTPVLVRVLGCDGSERMDAARELLALLVRLGGRLSLFRHSLEELRNVLRGAAHHLSRPDGRSTIIREARANGLSRSDLLLLAEKVEEKLSEAGIHVEDTPRHIMDYQIDESAFGNVLQDQISYYNPHAIDYDINSVRCIYVIRAGQTPRTVEESRAIFITSNSAFAYAASQYGRQNEHREEISSVITDFSLANMAWLKAPMDSPTIPRTQLLAFSYAAVEPSTELLEKFMKEIEKLNASGDITERDLMLLRSSPSVPEELMRLTLGEDAALTANTAMQTLEIVSREIAKEESVKLDAEKQAHKRTLDELRLVRERDTRTIEKHRRLSQRRGHLVAWIVSSSAGVVLLFGGLYGILEFSYRNPIIGGGLVVASAALTLSGIINVFFGTTLVRVHRWVFVCSTEWFFRRAARRAGMEFHSIGHMGG